MNSYQTVKEAVLRVAARGRRFQADDVRAELSDLPSNRNLIGLAFQHLSRAGDILPIGNTVSRTPTRAGGGQRLWVANATLTGQTLLQTW